MSLYAVVCRCVFGTSDCSVREAAKRLASFRTGWRILSNVHATPRGCAVRCRVGSIRSVASAPPVEGLVMWWVEAPVAESESRFRKIALQRGYL